MNYIEARAVDAWACTRDDVTRWMRTGQDGDARGYLYSGAALLFPWITQSTEGKSTGSQPHKGVESLTAPSADAWCCLPHGREQHGLPTPDGTWCRLEQSLGERIPQSIPFLALERAPLFLAVLQTLIRRPGASLPSDFQRAVCPLFSFAPDGAAASPILHVPSSHRQ